MKSILLASLSSLFLILGCASQSPESSQSTSNFGIQSNSETTTNSSDSQRFGQYLKLNLPSDWSIVPDSTGQFQNIILVRNNSTSEQFKIEIIKHSIGEPNLSRERALEEVKIWQSALVEMEKMTNSKGTISQIEGREWEVQGRNTQGQEIQAFGWIGLGKDQYIKLTFQPSQVMDSRENWTTIKSFIEYSGPVTSSEPIKADQASRVIRYPETGFELVFKEPTWFSLSHHDFFINPPQLLYTDKSDNQLLTLFSTDLSGTRVTNNLIIQAFLLNHGIEFNTSHVTLTYSSRVKDQEVILINFEDPKQPEKALRAAFFRKSSLVYLISIVGSKDKIHNFDLKYVVSNSQFTTPETSNNTDISSAELLNQVGILHLASNKPMVALSYFEKANKLNPNKPLFLLNSGFIYQLKNLEAPGIKVFESQMDMVQKHGKLLWILGEMYETRGYYDNALETYLKAIHFYPDEEELVINLSDAYWGAGYKMMSLRVVEDLYKKRPSERLGIYYAKTLIGLERHNDGIALLYDLKAQFGISKDLGHSLMKALLYLERFEEALSLQAQFAAKLGHDEHTYYAKGKSEFYLKQFKQAEISLQKSLKIESSNDEAASLLAATRSYLGKGKAKELKKKIAPTFALSNIKSVVNSDWGAQSHLGARVHFAKESLRFKKGDSWSITTELVVEITDSAGLARFQEFNEAFIPGYDRIYVNHLQTYDSNLKPKWKGDLKYYYVTAEMGSEISKQSQLAHLPVKNLAIGDFIQLQITRMAIRPAQYIPYLSHVANRDIPVYRDIFQVINPPAELDFEEFGKVSEKSSDNGYTWEFQEPKTIKIEPLMPNIKEIADGVRISESRTWASVGTEYEDLIKHQFANSIPIQEKALELKGNHHDIQFIVDTTVAWIRKNIRYRDIRLGGSSLIPAKSAQTLAKLEGDCKDQSLLLKEVLKVIGIESELVLINITEPVSPATATIQQFNHMILRIPPGQGVREQFIDLTESVGSHRIIPYSLEGRNALIVNGEKSRLITTPVLENSQEHQAEFNHEYFLNPDGSLEIKETIYLDGKFGALFREKLYGFTEDKMREYLRRWFAIEVPNIQVQTIKLKNLEEYTKRFQIDLILRSDQYWNPESSEPITLPNIWERTMMRLPQTSSREYPIRIPDQMKFTSRAKMTAPQGFVIKYPKKRLDKPSSTHYTEFSSQSQATSNAFDFQTQWTTYSAYAAPSEYLDLREEWNTILNETLVQIQVIGND